MPISGQGWELLVVRGTEQHRGGGGRRTVGKYQVYHDGVAQTGPGLSGTTAESKGPGANRPEDNGKRVEAGRYPAWTHPAARYATWGYDPSESQDAGPKPAFELKDTGERTEILLHPGHDFLASIGCINPCTSLPDPEEDIAYVGSHRRVIAILDDMKAFVGSAFPRTNGKLIPNAFVVIDGEP
jgi:hypothetical protein